MRFTSGGLPREGDAIDANTNNSASGESTEKSEDKKASTTSSNSKEGEKKGDVETTASDGGGGAGKQGESEDQKHQEPAIKVPERSRSCPKPKSPRHGKNDTGFHGFDDPEAAAKEAKKRAKERAALPAPKLIGRAAEREAEKLREREKSGFGGFGEDSSDSDSD